MHFSGTRDVCQVGQIRWDIFERCIVRPYDTEKNWRSVTPERWHAVKAERRRLSASHQHRPAQHSPANASGSGALVTRYIRQVTRPPADSQSSEHHRSPCRSVWRNIELKRAADPRYCSSRHVIDGTGYNKSIVSWKYGHHKCDLPTHRLRYKYIPKHFSRPKHTLKHTYAHSMTWNIV